ncbi:hypothetical protein [Paracoccus sp. SY]|uniref:hypothetical protein n=1 Tax=Paracoccus sp. SY TaxID=1330255 RepID=UPI001304C097|nr:hypothetical protein [Paracoccus sp. SY]
MSKAVPTTAYSVINGLPTMETVKRRLPKGLRQGSRDRFLTRRVSGHKKPDFSPTICGWLRTELAADTVALLEHCGKPRDHWRL